MFRRPKKRPVCRGRILRNRPGFFRAPKRASDHHRVVYSESVNTDSLGPAQGQSGRNPHFFALTLRVSNSPGSRTRPTALPCSGRSLSCCVGYAGAGELDAELTALAELAGQADLASEGLRQVLDDGQAQAGPSDFA